MIKVLRLIENFKSLKREWIKKIFNFYVEEIVIGSKVDGFWYGKLDEDYLIIFKDVKILDFEEVV